MRYCTNCGCELADNLKFCTRCGAAVEEDLEQGQENLGQGRKRRLPVVAAAVVIVLAVVGVGVYVILGNLSLPGDATSASPASRELESKADTNDSVEVPVSSTAEPSTQSSVPVSGQDAQKDEQDQIRQWHKHQYQPRDVFARVKQARSEDAYDRNENGSNYANG